MFNFACLIPPASEVYPYNFDKASSNAGCKFNLFISCPRVPLSFWSFTLTIASIAKIHSLMLFL